MTKALMVAAALGLAVSGANACELMRSAKVDTTTVTASTTETQSMSLPEMAVAEESTTGQILVDEEG
jgi:hypothetical protein